ncbi:MAG: zinc ribbon domain-containing protein [Candidatus Limisoma sp.]|nr:zinc ribbon domain-containing protein [Candidatus Limisoma sp.]
MGTFNTKKTIYASPRLIPEMGERIATEFRNEGYEVELCQLMSDGCDISITKGGTFKAIMGMRSALKVNLMPQGDHIIFDASVGIFGQQAIPTIISMFVWWPVLITQIWGMVNQAKLDDKALAIAEQVAAAHNAAARYQAPYAAPQQPQPAQGARFCTNCGTPLLPQAKFCPECGTKQ